MTLSLPFSFAYINALQSQLQQTIEQHRQELQNLQEKLKMAEGDLTQREISMVDIETRAQHRCMIQIKEMKQNHR